MDELSESGESAGIEEFDKSLSSQESVLNETNKEADEQSSSEELVSSETDEESDESSNLQDLVLSETEDESDSYSSSSCCSHEILDPKDALASEDFTQYRKAVELFVKNSVTNRLKIKTLKPYSSGFCETIKIASVLQLLVDSEISELKIKGCDISGGVRTFSKELLKTNIKKLVITESQTYGMLSQDLFYLMSVLKDTEISDLDVSSNDLTLRYTSIERISPLLAESHITVLNLSGSSLEVGAGTAFSECLLKTSITHLNLSNCKFSAADFFVLVLNLNQTNIIDLNLGSVRLSTLHGYGSLKIGNYTELCISLAGLSNVMSLDLSDCNLDNDCSLLITFLKRSEITNLNLENNCFNNIVDIFGEDGQQWKKLTYLNISGNLIQNVNALSVSFFASTPVSTLNFSSCGFNDESGQDLMKKLKHSNVRNLILAGNKLNLLSLTEFANVISDLKIEAVNFSNNSLSVEALAVLGDCLKKSTLKKLDVSDNFKDLGEEKNAAALAMLVEKTKGTRIESLKMSSNALSVNGTELIGVSLMNTTLTHLDLSSNEIGNAVGLLGKYLKSSAITHLNLYNNGISDEGAEALAKSLKQTKIIDLNLSKNSMHFHGASVLAMCIKDTRILYLRLKDCLENKNMDNEQYKDLAKYIEGSFLMKFSLVTDEYQIYIEEVLWRNKAAGSKLIKFFKLEMMPLLEDNKLPFNHFNVGVDFDQFLEKWLNFYKTVSSQPAAIAVLGHEESIPFSTEQIAELFLEEFPQELSQFIAGQIEVSVPQLVHFLKIFEEMGLSKLVELLLLHRPVLMIDENLNILHPYVYKLLHKYKQPICHFEMEPQKIIDYFNANLDLEGASDVIEILSNTFLQ